MKIFNHFLWLSSLSCSCVVLYFGKLTRLALLEETLSGICKYYLTQLRNTNLYLLLCSMKSNHEKKPKAFWLVITPVSLQPHQYMLFDGGMGHSVNSYSSLFNQGPNSPKFHGNPSHFVFTLHPSVFLHSYYHVTAQRLHPSYWHGSCKFNPSLHYNLVFLMFFFMEW